MARKKWLFNSWPSKFAKILVDYRQLDTTRFPKSFSIRPNARFEFNIQSFNELSIYKHPVTDFIIADQYLFKDQKKLEKNLPLLLESTIESRPNINCSIFGTLEDTFEKDPKRLEDICIGCLHKFQDIKVEVILNNLYGLKEHDRCLITNYFYFKPGSGFTLFNTDNKLDTKGTSIDVKSLFDFSEMEAAKNTIENLLRIKESGSTKSKALKMNRLFNLVNYLPAS